LVAHPVSDGSKGRAIGARVRHEKDHMTSRIVAPLQIDSSLESLAIGNPGLRLDPCSPWRGCPPVHFRIPSAKVAFDRNGHLGPPSESRVDASTKPLEQGELGPVPYWIAGRIGPKHEVETDNRAVVGKKRKIRERNVAALQPADARMGRANRATDFRLAEPGTDPGESAVIGHAAHSAAAASPRTIRKTFSRCHCGRSWHSPLCWRFTAINGTPGVPKGEPARRRQAVGGFRPLSGTPNDPIDAGTRESGGLRRPRSLVGTASVRLEQREGRRMAEAARRWTQT